MKEVTVATVGKHWQISRMLEVEHAQDVIERLDVGPTPDVGDRVVILVARDQQWAPTWAAFLTRPSEGGWVLFDVAERGVMDAHGQVTPDVADAVLDLMDTLFGRLVHIDPSLLGRLGVRLERKDIGDHAPHRDGSLVELAEAVAAYVDRHVDQVVDPARDNSPLIMLGKVPPELWPPQDFLEHCGEPTAGG